MGRKKNKEQDPKKKRNCKYCGEPNEDYTYDSNCDLCGASLKELYFDDLIEQEIEPEMLINSTSLTNDLYFEYYSYKMHKDIEKELDKRKLDKILNDFSELSAKMNENRRFVGFK